MRPNVFRRFRVGRIGIVDDEPEAPRAIGHIAEGKRRRDVIALAGILRGDVVAWLERGGGQRKSHRTRIGDEQGLHGEDRSNSLHAGQAAPLHRQSFSLI